MEKRIALGLMSIVSLAVLTACGAAGNGTNNAGGGSTGTAAQGGNLLEQIKKRGSIEIGTEGTYAPFSFHDSQNQLTGFDVELARAVAEQLGVKADFVETPWDGMLAGLNDKRFDMVANEVGVTQDRQKIYDFSTPYITSASVLIVRKDNTTIHSFKDLNGKKSAQTLTSNFGKMAQQNGATIVSVQGFNEALQLVESGRVDATINDKLSFLAFMKQHPDAPLKVVATNEDASQSAFAFRKGNPELVKAVNDALATIEKNGTYDKISKKWFNENVLH
jgi:L-cystine transport system substrate-binding protein